MYTNKKMKRVGGPKSLIFYETGLRLEGDFVGGHSSGGQKKREKTYFFFSTQRQAAGAHNYFTIVSETASAE